MSEYVFIKRQFDDAKFLPVILVHGLSGTAQRMIERTMYHVDRHLKVNTLLVIPTYVPPYQFLTPNLDRELISEVATFTRKKSEYHQKWCMYGFSAGAQFVHRFTYAHPEKVACCAAMAAGSWTYPDGTYSDHPSRPGFIDKGSYDVPEAHRVAERPARKGIDQVTWITGCGRQDERYERTKAFYGALKSAAPVTRFIGFNAGHRATDHVYQTVFQTFKGLAKQL